MTLPEVIRDRIGDEGPIPFATYAALALYHPDLGYYARADQRSGRAGDFYTSVDLGPAFGRLFEGCCHHARVDLLESAAAEDAPFYDAIRLHLVERSAAARGGQRPTLGHHAARLISSGTELPSGIRGVVFANELLDALPPHVLRMTRAGLRVRIE